ncbi:sugar transferase [Altererythrobacter sp. MF3-039]|uniref:sugar transferase n=1 Tax=Altererythrobacter sp. MF3-039 TaxID=3252901 RepID=UPI00390C52A1
MAERDLECPHSTDQDSLGPSISPFIRLVDFLVALVLVATLAIPMALIGLIIRRHDGGPALFRQVRVGRDLRAFTVYKFRTMTHDDSATRKGVIGAGDDREEARARFQTTAANDSRITPIGRLLRPSHLDELPQLFNVLLGDMSLVGVRPDTFAQEADYSPQYWQQRHRLRPGITGAAQIDPDATTMEGRTRAERRWLSQPTSAVYLGILFRTLGKVMKRSSN